MLSSFALGRRIIRRVGRFDQQQGIDLYRQGRKALAIEKFREAVRADPKLRECTSGARDSAARSERLHGRSFEFEAGLNLQPRYTWKHCEGSRGHDCAINSRKKPQQPTVDCSRCKPSDINAQL